MWILIYVLVLVSIQPVTGQGDCRCLDKSGCPNNCNSLCESGFSGPSCHAANIAVGKTASFSRSTTPLRGTPQQTVDGNTTDSNCPSVRGSNPSWEIRFGQTQTVTKVRIFWSSTELPTGFLAIIVSGFTCTTSKDTTQREVTYTCDQPQQGDSVMILIQAGTTTLTMCEVEIYECIDGYYGLDCASCDCNGDTNCDKVTGICDQPDTTTTMSTPPPSTTTVTTTTSTTTTPTTTTPTTTPTTTTPTTTTPTTTPTTTTPITTTTPTTTPTTTNTPTVSPTSPTTPTTASEASSTTQSSTTVTPFPSSSASMDSTTTNTFTAKSSLASSDTPTSPDATATGESTGTTTVKAPDAEYVSSGPGTLVIVAAVIVCIIGLILLIVIVTFACRISKKREEEALAKEPDVNGK